jgi:uncharacterized repeat protein (TIGR03843 family)
MSSVDLMEDEIVLHGRIMPASNATFLGEVGDVTVVYKPVSGERPLWDFPHGDLASREVAAYVVSEATGWDVVPQTWLRDGPHGLGMVQRWQEPDTGQAAVAIVPAGEVPANFRHVFDGVDGRDQTVSLVHEDSPPLRRMAVFDAIVNNADRKGGHVLEMAGGHRYGVDHGLTFHHEHKLRTGLGGWVGEPVRARVAGDLGDALAPLLTDPEIEALVRRCARLLAQGVMPSPRGEMPAIPWPPF